MSNQIVSADQTRRALAKASSITDVRNVGDMADVLRSMAKAARDREAELEAVQLRIRAERKLGEMLGQIKESGGLVPGARGFGKSEVPLGNFTLDELGIDRKLSMRAQQLAAVPEAEFETRLSDWRQEEEQRATRAIASLFKTVVRPAAPVETPDLPEGQYRVIYADPPWSFDTWSNAGKDRSAENHYSTMNDADICGLPVAGLAAEDCALFLWATGPKLQSAFDVITAWGFTYKTIGFTWAKSNQDPDSDFAGNGYWTRANAELCLLATRGKPERIAKDVNQLVRAPRGRHSAKPDEVAQGIERLVAGPYIELFRRGPARDGWDAWGNEAGGAP